MNKVYPNHIYDRIRQDVAVSYIQHEFRKLFLHAPEDYWNVLDKDIALWVNSPELATPRDFWNGFHGICMGFKLKIGLTYYVTAENVEWSRKIVPLSDLWFGVEFEQMKIIREGKLPVKDVKKYYFDSGNEELRGEWLKIVKSVSGRTLPRDIQPIIVIQKKQGKSLIYSVFDGNRRTAKALLEGKETIDAYIGEFKEGETIKNYWIPTTILMELILFAKQAYDENDKEAFLTYMEVLKDILKKSESAKYELKERSLTGSQKFKDEILGILGIT